MNEQVVAHTACDVTLMLDPQLKHGTQCGAVHFKGLVQQLENSQR